MKRQDIDHIYTELVADLLQRGYQIYPYTMGGSQGEWAHIDLSNGSEIVRVLIESEMSCGETYGDIVKITLGKCTDRIRGGLHDVIWNNNLEVSFQIRFARISKSFYTSPEESERMADVRFARYKDRQTEIPADLSDAYKSVALRWLRKQPRMKTCQLGDIEKMIRTTTYNGGKVCFEITAKGKKYILQA